MPLSRLVALVMVLASAAAAQTQPTLPDLVVEPSEPVDDRSMADFANLWWQWAAAMPPARSAVRDETGVACAEGQSGPVWFLAGGYGSSRIHRACSIPADRHLFFPVINQMQEFWPATAADCDAAKAAVAALNDEFVYLKVILDGVLLEQPERFRIGSETCFDPYECVPAEAGAPSDVVAATDGYWIMLRPLPPGPHRLEFRAFYTNPDEALGDMVQNISYDLLILPD